MSGLDQSIVGLCERHNLLCATVDCHHAPHGTWFNGGVQWDSDGERAIATCSADTFVDALNGAVAKMLAMRTSDIPADALELGS